MTKLHIPKYEMSLPRDHEVSGAWIEEPCGRGERLRIAKVKLGVQARNLKWIYLGVQREIQGVWRHFCHG